MLPQQHNPYTDCKSAQQCTTIRGSLYHSSKLHSGPCTGLILSWSTTGMNFPVSWLSLVPAVSLAEYRQVARVLIGLLSPIQLCQITEETPSSDPNQWKISHWPHPFLIHHCTTHERNELLPLC